MYFIYREILHRDLDPDFSKRESDTDPSLEARVVAMGNKETTRVKQRHTGIDRVQSGQSSLRIGPGGLSYQRSTSKILAPAPPVGNNFNAASLMKNFVQDDLSQGPLGVTPAIMVL